MRILFGKLPLLAALGAALLLAGCGDAGEAVSVSTACAPGGAMDSTYTGTNGNNGAMFSIAAGAIGVTIESFDINHFDTAGTASDWEIYFKSGSYIGSEATPSDWTLLGSATGVLSAGPGNATPLPIPVEVTVPSEQTYSFYVTRIDGGLMAYSNGTSEGAVFASDGSISLLEGKGVTYPFGSTNTPRVFNGTIHYSCA